MANNIRLNPLRRSQDFQRLRSEGRSFHVNSWLLANVQKTDTGVFRVGWTIPRQVGTAVVRNRLRRWGREYLRKWATTESPSLDLNLVFKRQAKGYYKSLGHKEFDEALSKLVQRIGRSRK